MHGLRVNFIINDSEWTNRNFYFRLQWFDHFTIHNHNLNDNLILYLFKNILYLNVDYISKLFNKTMFLII